MSLILAVVFLLSLAGIAAQTFLQSHSDRRTAAPGTRHGSKNDWAAVARALDLEVVSRGGLDDPLLRGSIAGHWLSVEQAMGDVEIDVHYLSDVEPFQIAEAPGLNSDDRIVTGDVAFDSELVLASQYSNALAEYLTPARRNALLWLKSSFTIVAVDNEDISVRFSKESWRPEDLIAAITLVVDVAEIMQAGQKLFMAPPSASDEPTLEVIDGGRSG